MEKLKKCSKCGRELPVSEFWKNASTEDGLQTYCKECGNPQPIPTLYLWNECTTRYDGTSSLTSMEILVI